MSDQPAHHSPTRVEGNEAFAETAASVCAASRYQIDILSHELAPDLWSGSTLIEAVKLTLVERPRARVRILINNARRVATNGSRLIDLSQHLSSAISVREMSTMHRDFRLELVLGDDNHALVRDPADRLDALHYDDDRVEVRTRRERFDIWWDAAEEAAGLRRLHI